MSVLNGICHRLQDVAVALLMKSGNDDISVALLSERNNGGSEEGISLEIRLGKHNFLLGFSETQARWSVADYFLDI